MSRVNASIEIDAPPERVWDVVMDPRCLGEWVTIHRGEAEASDIPLTDGSKVEQTLCLRGVNFHVKWKVEEAQRPTMAVWEGKGPARSKAHTSYRLEPNGNGGTRFDYENEFKAPLGPLGAVASRALVGGIPRREAERTLQALKDFVERG